MKAVTLSPAQILGVADQLGSLEAGKDANLVITAGHMLQPTTEVKGLFIGGKPYSAESRHTKLYGKYTQRLAEVQSGYSPLGIEVPKKPGSDGGAKTATAGPTQPTSTTSANKR